MSLLLIVPPDELILYLLSSLQLFTLIRFVVVSFLNQISFVQVVK
jgi:hypothetical protein